MCRAQVTIIRCGLCYNIDLVMTAGQMCLTRLTQRQYYPGAICQNLQIWNLFPYSFIDQIPLAMCRMCQTLQRGKAGYMPGEARPHECGFPVDPMVEYFVLLRPAPPPPPPPQSYTRVPPPPPMTRTRSGSRRTTARAAYEAPGYFDRQPPPAPQASRHAHAHAHAQAHARPSRRHGTRRRHYAATSSSLDYADDNGGAFAPSPVFISPGSSPAPSDDDSGPDSIHFDFEARPSRSGCFPPGAYPPSSSASGSGRHGSCYYCSRRQGERR